MRLLARFGTLAPAFGLLAVLACSVACGRIEEDGAGAGGGGGDVGLIPYVCDGQVGFGPDADGDGHAEPAEAPDACVTGEPTPEGYPTPDCDDDDSGVHPDAADYPGDGVDTNCDGVDGGAPPDPNGPTHYDYVSADLELLSECAEPDQVLGVTFGWRDIACVTTDGIPTPDLAARAQVVFRNPGTEPTPAVIAYLTSDLDPDFTLDFPVPALEPDEVTVPYALGWIPASVTLVFLGDITGCSAVPFETSSYGECVTK